MWATRLPIGAEVSILSRWFVGWGGLARERRGSARAVAEEAEGGSTSGGGMAEPLRQV